jgi:hypothetical protein
MAEHLRELNVALAGAGAAPLAQQALVTSPACGVR